MYLYALLEGECGIVIKVCEKEDIGRRLGDLGIIEGTKITRLGRSPLGDPTAYLIRGSVIALRKEDAAKVLVERDE